VGRALWLRRDGHAAIFVEDQQRRVAGVGVAQGVLGRIVFGERNHTRRQSQPHLARVFRQGSVDFLREAHSFERQRAEQPDQCPTQVGIGFQQGGAQVGQHPVDEMPRQRAAR